MQSIEQEKSLSELCKEAYKAEGMLGLAKIVADNEEIYNDFKPKNKHYDKPEALKVYESSNEFQKSEYDKKSPDWRQKSGSDTYMNNISSSKLENESNLYHLRQYHELLKEDMKRQLRISGLINMYTKEFDYRAVHKELPKDVQLFGGKVISTEDWDD